MAILITGVVVFIGVHLLPRFTTTRAVLIEHLGPLPYKGLFSVGALTGLVLMIAGFTQTDFVPVWNPPAWGRHFTMTLMLPAFVLFAGTHMCGNLRRFVRHPMLLGIILWSIGHLAANGDLASLILFGGIGLFALFNVWSANQRGAAKSAEPVPFKFDVIVVAAGLVAYAVALYLHGLFGVPVV